jgi:FkbM family methyltransferase
MLLEISQDSQAHDSQAKEYLTSLLRRHGWLNRIRPAVLASFLSRPILPAERRRIVNTDFGIRLYIDAFSHGGHSVLTTGTYEPETVEIFQQEIHPGDVCLDIGANEGILSSLMGHLAGPGGKVISVEPQSRLRDIIEINLAINHVTDYRVYQNVFGGSEGETVELNHSPFLNSGASSLMRRYRLGGSTETCRFVAPERILAECGLDHFDFVKVDVEGFEGSVVASLLPFIQAGQVRTLLVDYHTPILKAQGINAADVHASIISGGMGIRRGDAAELSSYILYGYE